MASREEEKRLRREEREKAERAAAASQARGRRLQFLLAGLVTIAVVVGVVLAVSGGGDDGPGTDVQTGATDGAAIPAVQERNLEKAVEAAGCELSSPQLEGATHVNDKVEYETNPPTSGDHNPEAALDGIYVPGNEPEPENYVHSLEHGRIIYQYKAGTPENTISQLETLTSEELNGLAGYKTLLLQNNTKMTPAVAATAWGQLLTCDETSDAMFDALRAFRVQYIDKGPENIPPTTG